MLYNKSAVKNPKPVSKDAIALAKTINPFKVSAKEMQELIENISFKKHKGILKSLQSFTEDLSSFIEYDHNHDFKGVRTAQETLKDKTGDCIEQATLLFAGFVRLFPHLKHILEIEVVKNPKGDYVSSLDDIGVHPFLVYRYSGKVCAFDAVTGNGINWPQKAFCIASEKFSITEFMAFRLWAGAEDLSFTHEKHDAGISLANQALKLDPNNYMLHCVKGDIFYLKNNYEKAEREYQRAISIAPDLLDTHKAYGDLLFNCHKSPKFAIKAYQAAVERDTADLQILHTLEQRLEELGEKKLKSIVSDKKDRLLKSKKFKDYLD